MSFDRAIEEIIQAAMARGEFQNLKGAGKPQDHSEYFALPEEDRLAFTVLKNSGYVPEEVALLRQIDERTLAFNLLQEQKAAARRRSRKLK